MPNDLSLVRYMGTIMNTVVRQFKLVREFYERLHCHDKHLKNSKLFAHESNSFVPPCSNDFYESTISALYWPRDTDLTLLMSQLIIPELNKTGHFSELANRLLVNYSDIWWSTNENVLRQNLARIVIHPSRMKSDEYLEKKAYTLFEALGEFGGICGLWCGLSFLTLFEIMELVADIVYLVLQKTPATENAHSSSLLSNNENSAWYANDFLKMTPPKNSAMTDSDKNEA